MQSWQSGERSARRRQLRTLRRKSRRRRKVRPAAGSPVCWRPHPPPPLWVHPLTPSSSTTSVSTPTNPILHYHCEYTHWPPSSSTTSVSTPTDSILLHHCEYTHWPPPPLWVHPLTPPPLWVHLLTPFSTTEYTHWPHPLLPQYTHWPHPPLDWVHPLWVHPQTNRQQGPILRYHCEYTHQQTYVAPVVRRVQCTLHWTALVELCYNRR